MPMYQNYDDSYKYIEEFYNQLQLRDAVGKAITGEQNMIMILVINNEEYIINSQPDIIAALNTANVPQEVIDEIILSKFQLFEKTLFKDPDFDKNQKYWEILIKMNSE